MIRENQELKSIRRTKVKSIRNILKEEENQAHAEALQKGLKYKGFGYWMDPQTGETKYKTVGNELVPIDPKELEDQQKQSQEQQMGMGGMPEQSPEGMSFDSFKDQEGMPKGTGENILGVSKTGEAKGPNPDNMAWDPGPDGDTFVGGQQLAQWNVPPKDSFVGKKNYYKWTAGPDGDNFKTRTYDDLKKEFIGNHDEKQRDIDAAAGRGYGAGEAGPVEPYTTRESFEPHAIDNCDGADDMRYIALMNEYYRLRYDHSDSYEAQKMYDSAMFLFLKGDVSLNAKIYCEAQ